MKGVRARYLSLGAVGVVAVWVSATADIGPRIVYNASPSLPTGYYWITPTTEIQRGHLVLVPVPSAYRSLVEKRRYLGPNVPLIKPVAALEGDHVCIRNGAVSINGKVVGHTLKSDSKGRVLNAWKGCQPLTEGEFFALIAGVRESLDSRYFGPLRVRSVIGRAWPLWVNSGGER